MRMAGILDKKRFYTLGIKSTLRDLLLLWQNSPVDIVGVLDEAGKLAGVLGKEMPMSSRGEISFSTPVAELMSTDFALVTTDTTLDDAWKMPGAALAVVGAVGELLALFTKSDLAVHLYQCTNLINRQLDAILNAAPTGIVAIDKEGVITAFNPAAEKITWRKRKDAIGRHLSDVIIPTGLLDVLKTGKPSFAQKLPINYSRGARMYVTNRTPIIEEGKVVGAVGIFQDISEFEFLTKELAIEKELNKELKALIESSYDGILIADSQGVVRQVNKAYLRMTGLKEYSVVNRPFKEVALKGNHDHSILKIAMDNMKSVTQIQVSPRGDRFLITANPVLNEKNVISRVVVYIRELTELDNLRQELLDTKSLNKRYKAELNNLQSKYKSRQEIVTSNSPEMKRVIDMAVRVAQVDSTVLILGESGVGKEVIARLIHNSSRRKNEHFIKINCGAIPEALLESELFGYERGAFTGAGKEGKAGLFELADKGTILLDEIGDLPLAIQVKLLRVLQDKEFTRVGGISSKKVDVRILAATNRDLEKMIQQGRFREDLYFRLNVIPLYIPPLRHRKSDIIPLLNFFIEKCCSKYDIRKKVFAPEVIRMFLDYDWPGNVREMENMVERLLVTSSAPVITPDCLPVSFINKTRLPNAKVLVQGVLPLKEAMFELEQQLVIRAMEQYGSTYKAAKALGVNQSTVARKLARIRKESDTAFDLQATV